MNTLSEVDLCAAAIDWFKSQGWTVHQEVELPGVAHRTRRVDLIIEREGEYRVVEAKTTLSPKVINQAAGVRQFAHRVYVLVPAAKSKSGRDDRNLLLKTALAMGVGVIEHTETGCKLRQQAKFNADADTSVITLKLALHTPGPQAGSPTRAAPGRGQERWDRLRDFLLAGEATGKEIRIGMSLTKPEFNELMRCGRRGEIHGVKTRNEGGFTVFVLEDDGNA